MSWNLKEYKTVHLIINDDQVHNEVIKLLGKLPLEIKSFDAIDGFLSAPICEAPACLITEFKLDDMDGINFINQLRAHGLSTPVVVIANVENNINIAVKAIQAGATDFISIPIVERDFIERIESILKLEPRVS